MELTTNYQLKKIGYDDPASIIDFMGNFDTIDALLKSANDGLSSKAGHTEYVADVDLNTLLEDKAYICAGTLKNAPIPNTYCVVQVYDTASTSRILQICYVPQVDNTVRMFSRFVTSGVTGSLTIGVWREIATTNLMDKSVEVLQAKIDDNTFRTTALAGALTKALTTLVLHTFADESDLDDTKGDGAAAIANYYDADLRLLNKTEDGTVIIYTMAKVVSSGNNNAWAIADWSNVSGGSVELAISRNSGVTYTVLTNDALTSISSQAAGVVMNLRITLTGKLKLKNVAWGCKA